MIFKNLDFHNIEEIYSHKNINGVLLARTPERVSRYLSKVGQIMMLCLSGSEIRFVSDTYPVKITLSVDKIIKQIGDSVLSEVCVFFGGLQLRQRFTITQEKTTINIIVPPKFFAMTRKIAVNTPFSPNVCRIRFWGTTMGTPIRFHDIETRGDIRPPTAEEVPGLRYLAYGSSVTQGAYASGPHLSFVDIVGTRLGADVINLGTSCSAYCEPELADYIAERNDWDFATLALSVNMVDCFSPKDFSERVNYMIDKIAKSNENRPVICITLKPYYGDYIKSKKPDVYRDLLRNAVKNSSHKNVYLVEGPELMPDVAGGLCSDLIHLGDYGMMQIGMNLAEKLEPILQSHGLLTPKAKQDSCLTSLPEHVTSTTHSGKLIKLFRRSRV
ncbi:MAG: SGNH/GDSL hydrolase family protein [Smithella sp.]|nr:SGNH/GDSL hydrolase family protein [Smithella sp.]